ncbi:peptidylprolyl isomerase [Nitrosococcus oceani]|uniref:Chaperone SurA n=2 Tax=Nitrosococcus oceani TaxID=1229 RepID=SURA_NITOC|nr:peptidylprolyl isomerase [Nitrosococcus oceani]Q3JAF1.1 RecName: Full=Chaperone SurA; AltName: Full=Peptidyl-prolyl cis-trans isomerase SurA; Short=PPIase SurA; AltName: Full=Rotamase SurA; Flags: Precursor [Nitrosococcus oceani ATCC 19707]KFI19308.1 molecular chaperone SurA [Nitrosococcus oceani C-27]ABA58195.1 PpiC-type peptidyl-prolyl cis-trans isomerase [Nitrosococcus oceani ATCC 19707]EDZ67654.1 SurA N-terminal domain family [Nitrosococcus oceani AFC27]KFI22622.1 molecular chaperone Su
MGRVLVTIFVLFWPIGSFAAINLDRIVAVVNEDIVLESELEQMVRTVQDQLAAQGTSLPPGYVLERQVLERLVMEQLQLQLAARTGIQVGDETLNEALGRIAQDNGLTLSQFRNVLEQDGYDFPAFRENIRKELIISQLHKREVNDRVSVSKAEIDNFLTNQKKRGNQDAQYHLAHILITVPEAASPEQVQAAKAKAEQVLQQLREGADFQKVAVTYSDGQQALEGGDLGWRKMGQLPTLFVDVVPQLQAGDISKLIRSPSGFHIVKLLDYRGEGQQQLVTQTQARHILLRADELASEREVQLRLSQLRQRILSGDDFSELAQAHSDDKASALKGGDLGWVSPGQMIPRFEEAMRSLEPGEISEPFKTQFGWHVVQVLDRRQENMTEEFNRNRAKMEIRQRKVEEELENWLRQLRDEAYVEYRLDN